MKNSQGQEKEGKILAEGHGKRKNLQIFFLFLFLQDISDKNFFF
jgi:hypothetical protein